MRLLFALQKHINVCRAMNGDSVKGVPLKDVTQFLKSFAPITLSENWDNTGLLVEPITPKKVSTILLTNDLTESVLEEAVAIKANLIISYHPPIFKPLTQITTATWKERIIGSCLENKIAVYSPHTSWDAVSGGVNDWLAGAFESLTTKPIVANPSESESTGIGRYGTLEKEITISEAVQLIKKLTNQDYLSVAFARNATLETPIKSIAICAGAGTAVLSKAKADLFITGEMSHHSLLDAIHCNTTVILCNHSNSERGFLKYFKSKLESRFDALGIEVHISKEDKDPIRIL